MNRNNNIRIIFLLFLFFTNSIFAVTTSQNKIDCDTFRDSKGQERINGLQELLNTYFNAPGSVASLLVDPCTPKGKIHVNDFILACGKPSYRGDIDYLKSKDGIFYSVTNDDQQYSYISVIKEGDFITRLDVAITLPMEINTLVAKHKQRKDELASREEYKPIEDISSLNSLFGIHLGESAEDVLARADKLNIKVFNMGRQLQVEDNLDNTSAGISHKADLFERKVFKIRSDI